MILLNLNYRKKDLGNNSDLTAQIFNQKRAERDAETESEEADRARRAALMAYKEANSEPVKAGTSKNAIGKSCSSKCMIVLCATKSFCGSLN